MSTEFPATPEAKVAFLSNREAYPHQPDEVQLVETHLAWVFLAGDFVYKLKKPIATSYLDFRTVETRRAYCEEEVRLNRRLAPDVYLGTVPLASTSSKRLELGGDGAVVDWLVHMRRLPAQSTLEHLVDSGAVPPEAAVQIAERLARFYGTLPPASPVSGSVAETMRTQIMESHRELSTASLAWDEAMLCSIVDYQLKFLDTNAAALAQREKSGRVVEAHGDLRLQHVYLLDEPVIIDCLEFNRDLRILDSASELAFLALECERHGNPALGQRIFHSCNQLLGDAPPAPLLRFYRVYHACMRAKLTVWRLQEPRNRKEKYEARLRAYLALAQKSYQEAQD